MLLAVTLLFRLGARSVCFSPEPTGSKPCLPGTCLSLSLLRHFICPPRLGRSLHSTAFVRALSCSPCAHLSHVVPLPLLPPPPPALAAPRRKLPELAAFPSAEVRMHYLNSDDSLRDQAALFWNTSLLIWPHGATMALTFFLPKVGGAAAIECGPAAWQCMGGMPGQGCALLSWLSRDLAHPV